jgi:hypothetical protein
MTGDTTPQDLAIKAINDKFNCEWGSISLEPYTLADLRHTTPTAKVGPRTLDTRKLTLGEIVDCLADAGLLCSSPAVQPKDEEGSLRSEPSAAGRHDLYVRLMNEPVHRTSCHSDNTVNVDLDGNGVPAGVEVLNAIGLEVDGQPVNLPEAIGEAATEKLIDVVAEALRERPFRFGPNTRESIVRGMDKVFLTGNERRDLARMALDAVNQVMRDE